MMMLFFYLSGCSSIILIGMFLMVCVVFLILNMGFSFSYFFSFDLFSVVLLFLSLLIIVFMLLSGCFEKLMCNAWGFLMGFLLLLVCSLLVVFMTSSFFIFYMFFEFGVIPVFIMIMGWGYSLNRFQASIYMFLYTLMSSFPFLIGLVFFSVSDQSHMYFLVFYGFLGVFSLYWWVMMVLVLMVKLPIFFLHLWLPKAHVDAPVLGSMILAGVMLKLGGYGSYKLLTFSYFGVSSYIWFFMVFSLMGSVMVSFLCLQQVDVKSLVAYSSVVHMGPVFALTMSCSFSGVLGSFFMMFSHGLCSSALFFLLNTYYLSLGSRSFFLFRGSMFFFPIFSFFWFFYCMCNMGCPPSLNFFSEVLMVFTSLLFSKVFYFMLAVLMVMSGFYCVLLYVFMGHGNGLTGFMVVFMNMGDMLSCLAHGYILALAVVFINMII